MMDKVIEIYPVLLAVASGKLVNMISNPVLNYAYRRWGIKDRSERWLIVVGVNVVVSLVAYGLIVAANFEPFVIANLLGYALASYSVSQAWWALEVRGQANGAQDVLTQLTKAVDDIFTEVARPDAYSNRQYTISAEAINKLGNVRTLNKIRLKK